MNKRPKTVYLAWPAVAASLTAFAALWYAAPTPLILLLAVLLVLHYVIPYRFSVVGSMLVRVAGMGGIVWFDFGNAANIPTLDAFNAGPIAVVVAELLCFEIVVQAYHWYRNGPVGAFTFLSGAVFMAGCAVHDARNVTLLAPIYFTFVVLTLRADHDRRPFASPTSFLLAIPVLAIALLLGGYGQYSFHRYRTELMGIDVNLFSNVSGNTHIAAGIDKNPDLRSAFGRGNDTTRLIVVDGRLPDPHLHGMAFDIYDNGFWKPGPAQRKYVSYVPSGDLEGDELHLVIHRLVVDDGIACAPVNSVSLVSSPDETPLTCYDLGGPVRLHDFTTLDYSITMVRGGATDDAVGAGPLNAPPDKAELKRCLAVPVAVDHRVIVLAQSITSRCSTTEQKINAITTYLMTHNKYSEQCELTAGDPVSAFVLGHAGANCEFFGSAATVMLRSIGIPTRYIIGYYAHEMEGPNSTVVRARDAHAWAESWVDGGGWITVDATPSGGLPDRLYPDPWYWKWMDYSRYLAAKMFATAVNLLRRHGRIATALVTILTLTALSVTALLRRRFKTSARREYSPVRSAELANIRDAFSRWLSALGGPCDVTRTWSEFVALVGGATAAGPQVTEFLDRYNAARFGTPTDHEIEKLHELLTDITKGPT